MYRDFELFRRGRGAAGIGGSTAGACCALFLAVSFAGCVGTVSDGTPDETGEPTGTGDPANPGFPGTGTSPPVAAPAEPTSCKANEIGFSPLRRLTREEYDNSVRDLLGVDLGLAKDFSADELAGPFPSNYFTPISESNYSQYAAAAANAAVKTVERLGQLVPCAAGVNAGNEAACATTFIRQFGRRAYRRPLDDAEIGRYEALFKVGRQGGDFAAGINLVVQGMLESPHFIYLVEGPAGLTHHQLAARLSYFLWNAPPDATLATKADAGALGTPEALRVEARRMLADPRAQAMIEDFHHRWLALEDLDGLPDVKDAETFPDFKAIHPFMKEELKRFTSHVMTEGDGKLETLLTAPFTIANAQLAKHYGAQSSGDWKKVELDRTQRAGILTQGAFLATHGHEGSSPIFRGIAVREQLFCVDLPPPPPGADANLPPPAPTKTTRDRVAEHRNNPECAACHNLMDVLGYGFESFDEVGKFRTTENGVRIDDSGEFVGTDIDGAFKGPVELSRRLAGSPMVQKCVTKQWFRYALGRIETDLDKCTLNAVYERFKKNDLSLPELLMALVESDAFRIRRTEEMSK